MTLIDTHIWIWWVNQDSRLSPARSQQVESLESSGLCVSVISCWEVAKLVESGRIALEIPVLEWIRGALAYPGVRLLELSPEIAVESTRLPQPFHRDPADQILVATARTLGIPLMTDDRKILAYPHVTTLTSTT